MLTFGKEIIVFATRPNAYINRCSTRSPLCVAKLAMEFWEDSLPSYAVPTRRRCFFDSFRCVNLDYTLAGLAEFKCSGYNTERPAIDL